MVGKTNTLIFPFIIVIIISIDFCQHFPLHTIYTTSPPERKNKETLHFAQPNSTFFESISFSNAAEEENEAKQKTIKKAIERFILLDICI
jgi:hypothetical protein